MKGLRVNDGLENLHISRDLPDLLIPPSLPLIWPIVAPQADLHSKPCKQLAPKVETLHKYKKKKEKYGSWAGPVIVQVQPLN